MEAALARRLLPFGSSKFDCFEFSLLEFGCFAFGCFVFGCFEFTLQISTMHDKNYNVGYVITITTQCRTGTVGLTDDSKVCNVEKSRYKMSRVQNERLVRYIGDYAFQAEFFEPCTPPYQKSFRLFDCRNTMYNVGRFVHSFRTVLHNTMQGQ